MCTTACHGKSLAQHFCTSAEEQYIWEYKENKRAIAFIDTQPYAKYNDSHHCSHLNCAEIQILLYSIKNKCQYIVSIAPASCIYEEQLKYNTSSACVCMWQQSIDI